MAGNIVHAIATTNAAIAGLIVVEAYKILAGMPERCKVAARWNAFSQCAAMRCCGLQSRACECIVSPYSSQKGTAWASHWVDEPPGAQGHLPCLCSTCQHVLETRS